MLYSNLEKKVFYYFYFFSQFQILAYFIPREPIFFFFRTDQNVVYILYSVKAILAKPFKTLWHFKCLYIYLTPLANLACPPFTLAQDHYGGKFDSFPRVGSFEQFMLMNLFKNPFSDSFKYVRHHVVRDTLTSHVARSKTF